MSYMKKLLNDVKGLPESKMESISNILAHYSEKLEHTDKKDMEYMLASEIYGEKLTMTESEYIVSEMFGRSKSGKHWTMDQVKSVASSKGVEVETDKYSFGDLYAVIHSMYYDHCDMLKMLTSDESKMAEYSLMLAKGFLEDLDAQNEGLGKARKYYHYVV